MSLTFERQSEILHQAARTCGMDGHTSEHTGTAAERVMLMFGGKKQQPRKNSYLYCSSVDACFYIIGQEACCTFTARWRPGSGDLDLLGNAGQMIKKMLLEMQRLIDWPTALERQGWKGDKPLPDNPETLLTLDELRQMEGEPVWILDGVCNEIECLRFDKIIPTGTMRGDDFRFEQFGTDVGIIRWERKYGVNWVAYRFKPAVPEQEGKKV